MALKTIGLMSPGDMGHGVGRALVAEGYRVITDLTGRSERSRKFAAAAGLIDAGSLAAIMKEADLVLSIMPPGAALGFAEEAAAAMRQAARAPAFADCNAVSPETAERIGAVIQAAGAPFIDAGIIGPPPGRGAPRFYTSGPAANVLDELDGKGLIVKNMGPVIGRASAIKMVYAGMNKGIHALVTGTMIAAHRLGLTDALLWELERSQKAIHDRVTGAMPWLATDAERWAPEMDEIAATFESVGVTGDFHHGAAAVWRLLAQTPLAAETRETVDKSRSVKAALDIFAAQIDRRQAAE